MLQTKKMQIRTIEAASKLKTLHELCWFPEAQRGKTTTIAVIRENPVIVPVIPLITVGCDDWRSEYELSYLLATLMCKQIRHYDRLWQLQPGLTTFGLIIEHGARWWLWGDIDTVCPNCGMVGDQRCCSATLVRTPRGRWQFA